MFIVSLNMKTQPFSFIAGFIAARTAAALCRKGRWIWILFFRNAMWGHCAGHFVGKITTVHVHIPWAHHDQRLKKTTDAAITLLSVLSEYYNSLCWVLHLKTFKHTKSVPPTGLPVLCVIVSKEQETTKPPQAQHPGPFIVLVQVAALKHSLS